MELGSTVVGNGPDGRRQRVDEVKTGVGGGGGWGDAK